MGGIDHAARAVPRSIPDPAEEFLRECRAQGLPDPPVFLRVVGEFLPRRRGLPASSPLLRVVGAWCDDYCYTAAQAGNALLVEMARMQAGRGASTPPALPTFCPKCRAYHMRREAA